ncbi:MAG: hypothetical protein H6742_16960 [Alphaproteobacteria bacterium]|nr:hypothetical protein [Alphaproteobacteria bacterium]
MGMLPLAALGFVLLVTGFGAVATWADLVPAETVGEEQTVSLREESTRSGGGFFVGYSVGRSHRGGGLRGGK